MYGRNVAFGDYIGWMSDKPFVINRSSILTADWKTRPYGMGIALFEDNGRRLSMGQNPCKHPLVGAVACLGRQLHASSTRCSRVPLFRRISAFVCQKVLEDIGTRLRSDAVRPVVDRELFDRLLSHLSAAFRDEVWNMYEEALRGRVSGDYRKAGAFVKQEDSHKSDLLGTHKPRNITTMTPEMYVHALPALLAQYLIYNSLLKRWMIKSMTPNEIDDIVRRVSRDRFRAVDVSGFEKAMTVEMMSTEIELVTGVLRLLNLPTNARFVENVMYASRKLDNPYYSYSVGVRCSGDFWTSLGNGLANIVLILTGHYEKCCNGMDLDEWWVLARELVFVTEGDDGFIPEDIFSPETTRELYMDLSLSTPATQPGGADFLKIAYYPVYNSVGVHVGRLGNTLRWCRSLMFVRGANLRPSKVRFLWRAKALSMLYLAPAHPIITVLARRIGELTQGARWFRGAKVLSKKWGVDWDALGDITKPFPEGEDWQVRDEMRVALASSVCPELPAISVENQLALEALLAKWTPGTVVQIPHEWRLYPEYGSAMSGERLEPEMCVSRFLDPVVETLWKLMCEPPPVECD